MADEPSESESDKEPADQAGDPGYSGDAHERGSAEEGGAGREGVTASGGEGEPESAEVEKSGDGADGVDEASPIASATRLSAN